MKKKRIISFILSLALTVSFFASAPLGGVKAKAEPADGPDTVYADNYDDFVAAMEGEGDYDVVLTDDIEKTLGSVEHWDDDGWGWGQAYLDLITLGLMEIVFHDTRKPVYVDPNGRHYYDIKDGIDNLITVGSGTKRLILDGYDIDISYPNMYDNKATLFYLGDGVDLTVYDEQGGSEIFFDGYIPDSSDWEDLEAPLNRDIFTVGSGANLTINGGTIMAGRSKLEKGFSIFNAVDMDNSPYTGSATRILSGTAINIYSGGNVTVNKGKIIGRGYEKLGKFNGSTQRNDVVEFHGGSITINDAYIYAQSGANCFSINIPDNAIKINAGKIELHRNDALFIGDFGALAYTIDDSPTYGAFNIPKDACDDWNRVQVDYYYKEKKGSCPGSNSDWRDYAKEYVEGKNEISDYDPSVRIYPRGLDFVLDSYADPGANPAILDNSIMNNNEFLFQALDREWLFNYIPHDVRDRGGWTSTLKYSLYDEDFKEIKLTDSTQTFGTKDGDGDIEIDLEDHMDVSKLEYGKTYYLCCELNEKYNGSVSYSVDSVGGAIFTIGHHEPPEVLSIDDKAVAEKKGDTVTINAVGKNATSAYWEKRSFVEGSTTLPCTSFETQDGLAYASLDVTPTCNATYYCHFVNRAGDVISSVPATVDYVPSFTKTAEENRTIYAGTDITLSQPIDHSLDEIEDQNIKIRWYFKKEGADEFKVVSDGLYSDGTGKEYRGTNLYIAGGKKSYAGQYYAEVRNTLSDDPFGTAHTSPIITVTYSADEQPSKYITQPEIFGFGDLCVGDPAPTVDDLYTYDPRFEIKSITWTKGVDANGYINSTQPSYTITLASKAVPTFMFQFNSEGKMPWTIDGTTHYATGTANSAYPGVDLTFSYNGWNFLYPPADKVIFDKTTFSMEKGETVDIPLHITVVTNERFAALGETHTLSSLVLTQESVLPLPEGLSLVKESDGYHIKGTVTENSGTVYTAVTANVSNGNQWGQSLYFYILPDPDEAVAQQEEINDSLHTTHSFNGDWIDAGDGTHIQGCSECSEFRVEEHTWGEGEIITEATEESEGTILYTCTVCGAEKTESITYDAKKCTITFDPNDGVNEPVSLITSAGVIMTLPENPFTGNGKAFDGWSIGQPGEKIVINENLYINACWNDGKITVDKQPVDVITKTGNTAKFTFAVTSNYVMTYQWQVSTDNGLSWKNSSLSGNKTRTISVGATVARSGYLFRCVVSDKNGNCITSEPARLIATTTKPTISTQPKDQAAASGENAYFTVTAGNYDGTAVSYQWQASTDGGATWKNSGLKGNKTDTLNVAVTEARAGYKFRCVVTSGTKKVTSKSAKLIVVKDAIAVSTQPSDVTASENASVKFSVNASSTTDSALSYQWQVSTDGGKSWNNSGLTGNKTKVLTVKATAARDGYLFRCKITDENGMKVTSSKAKLTVVSEVIKISKQPANLAKAAGTTAKFTVKAESTQGYTLSYQWQALKPGGEWKNSGLKGNKTATLSVDATSARNGYKFRCVITDSKGNSVISSDAELTVTDPVQ